VIVATAGPIDLGPLLFIVFGAALFCGVVFAGVLVLAARRRAQLVIEGAVANVDEIEEAENRLRLLGGGPQPVFPGSDDFLDGAQSSMLAIAQARAAHQLETVAALLTPDYYETLLAEQRAAAEPPAQLDVEVVAARIDEREPGMPMQADPSVRQDIVVAWFGATLRLHTADRRGAPLIKTTVTAQVWRFVRAQGRSDQADPLLAARLCPNCGASLGDDASGVCGYCHQVTVGNTQGWLVGAIEIQPLT
jgi:hypothetical protein